MKKEAHVISVVPSKSLQNLACPADRGAIGKEDLLFDSAAFANQDVT